jgi:hypothetical protein
MYILIIWTGKYKLVCMISAGTSALILKVYFGVNEFLHSAYFGVFLYVMHHKTIQICIIYGICYR